MSNVTVQADGLRQVLRLPQIIALYIGSVVGSGILLIPGMAAEAAGPASILAWLAMSLLVVPMAVTMGLLASKYPSAGGVSHFARLAFGPQYGSLVGWFFYLSVPLGAPVLAVTGSQYLAVLLDLSHDQLYALAAVMLLLPIVVNVFGLKLAGGVQTAVIAMIIAILLLAIFAAIPHQSAERFTPFVPHGWFSVAQAAGLLFWCFIGWEAVTHLSSEFVNPERDAIRGVLWSAGIVALLYFSVAYFTIATGSYGGAASAASLSMMVQLSLGQAGGWAVALAALFICFAGPNAYVSAASRIAYSLAREGAAPKVFGFVSPKFGTPTGGLLFIAAGSFVTLGLMYSGVITLSQLIQWPNATFVATYLAGCLAGVKLLKGSKLGRPAAIISFACTLCLYPFLGWSALYPPAIAVVVWLIGRRGKRKA
ncbi:APC family permease [Paenibacillus soyae]|uniref:Amino acid permease n=1 Tax=Paenibacillus soyae TaxID=2969249 RepID=A0A9X2MTM2_9BACL|nr:amino acid permease [Paenibacillus soyae]MCR2806039.1 amino acid permease [Paenibacillus soyae]